MTSLALLTLITEVSLDCLVFAENPDEWVADADTVVAIVPVEEGGNFLIKDLVTNTEVTAAGASISNDNDYGLQIDFGSESGNKLSISHAGSEEVLRGSGFTLDFFVKPTSATPSSYILMLNLGGIGNFGVSPSGTTSPAGQPSPNIPYFSLPSDSIYLDQARRDTKTHVDHYPVAWRLSGTPEPIIPDQWNHIIFTYNESLKRFRIWVNGVIARDEEIVRHSEQWVNLVSSLRFYENIKNASVGGVRLRKGMHEPYTPALMNVFLNQFPWQGKMVLSFDKIDPAVELPITYTATLDGVSGGVYSVTVNTRELTHLEVPMPGVTGTVRDVLVEATSGGTPVFSETMHYCDRITPEDPLVEINDDLSISKNGERIFPLMIYGVHFDEFAIVKDLGFNTLTARDPYGPAYGINSFFESRVTEYLDTAASLDLLGCVNPNLLAGRGFADKMSRYRLRDSMFFIYTADEPYNDWDGYRNKYNLTREIEAEFPQYIVVNTETHLPNANTACDIIATDPYCAPTLSTRHVTTLTKDSVRESYGMKPVWTVLGCYEDNPANEEELRNMAYLALCAGARGLGLYAWDSRNVQPARDENGNADYSVKGVIQDDNYYMNHSPNLKNATHRVFTEMKELSSIFIEANEEGAVSIDDTQISIAASIKVLDGKRYLLLANDERIEKPATLTLENPETLIALPHQLSDMQSSLNFVNGVCQVTVPALGTGLFALDGSPVAAEQTLVIEAEDYAAGIIGSGDGILHAWQAMTDSEANGGHSGDGYFIRAIPNDGYDAGSATEGARLSYPIDFIKSGTYYLHIRGKNSSTNDDEIHIGLNGLVTNLNVAIPNTGEWAWTSGTQTINIPSLGEHVLHLWMVEDGVEIDQLVLTTDSNWVPTDDKNRLSSCYLKNPNQTTSYEDWARLNEFPTDPNADSDGDGQSNFEDYIYGQQTGNTPHDEHSNFRSAVISGGVVTAKIEFNVRPSYYRVQETVYGSTSLINPQWEEIDTVSTKKLSNGDTHHTMEAKITFDESKGYRFFRLGFTERDY